MFQKCSTGIQVHILASPIYFINNDNEHLLRAKRYLLYQIPYPKFKMAYKEPEYSIKHRLPSPKGSHMLTKTAYTDTQQKTTFWYCYSNKSKRGTRQAHSPHYQKTIYQSF